MSKNYPNIPFERYADDAVCHCKSLEEVQHLKTALSERMKECKLELHPQKTKIVYCKDDKRKGEYENISFDFLGFTFQPRQRKNFKGEFFVGFNPAISIKASKRIRLVMRRWNVQRRSDLSLEELSSFCTPVIRGWINYYSLFRNRDVLELMGHFDRKLQRWATRKFKSLKSSPSGAKKWLTDVAKRDTNLFPHWQLKYQMIKQ